MHPKRSIRVLFSSHIVNFTDWCAHMYNNIHYDAYKEAYV